MTTFIKVKLKKPDDQTNIDKRHSLTANIAESHIISKLTVLRIPGIPRTILTFYFAFYDVPIYYQNKNSSLRV